MTYVRTYYYPNSRLNRPESVSLSSLARQLYYNINNVIYYIILYYIIKRILRKIKSVCVCAGGEDLPLVRATDYSLTSGVQSDKTSL